MSPIKRGLRIRWDEHGDVVVMAVADGYAMCRRPRCAPFVVSVKELERRLQVEVSE